MKEVVAVSAFPIDFCGKFLILNRGFCTKKCDASLWYFILKLDGIVFFVQVIQTVCEFLFSTSPYEKYIVNESYEDLWISLKERVFIFLLKVIHENICIRWCAYRTHDTSICLKIVFALEHEVV